jgi:hypothetical protein
MDYYLLFVWGCVEPELVGPFATTEERNSEAQKYHREHGEQHGYFPVQITKGCQIEIECFSGSFFGE